MIVGMGSGAGGAAILEAPPIGLFAMQVIYAVAMVLVCFECAAIPNKHPADRAECARRLQ